MAAPQDWTWNHPDLAAEVELQKAAWNISTFGGRKRMASRRGQNNEVSYRDGSLWTPKDYNEHEIDLAMWVVGSEEDGDIPDDPSDQFWLNLQTLQRAFVTDRQLGTLTYMHPVGDKLVTAEAEVADVIDFSTHAGATRAAFIARLILPKVHFRDVAYFGDAISTSRANGATWNFAFDSDVMVRDPLITLEGLGSAATNPKIFNTALSATDNWVQYAGVISPGDEVIIDPEHWRATINGAKATGALVWSGQPQFFWLKNGTNSFLVETDNALGVQSQGKGRYW